jgi:putative methionine-R-sulfoxide reductase with GAF domain
MTLVTSVVASLIAAGIVALIGYLCRERLKRWRTRRQAGGEQLKIAWFRRDNGVLLIHREVGHDEDRVATVRLPLGTGIAASAYSQQSTITLGDLSGDPRFEYLPGGENEGAIICTPVLSGHEATGVLSVLSTRKDAFGALEGRYIEALAACIAAMERLEEQA